jgi:hypothetical protein
MLPSKRPLKSNSRTVSRVGADMVNERLLLNTGDFTYGRLHLRRHRLQIRHSLKPDLTSLPLFHRTNRAGGR